jgi:choline dehydrogenase-like flavoprotein
MRASPLRDRLGGIEMFGEDLAQATNFVDLDPTVKDVRGYPVARITYSPHNHELTAQRFYIPQITAILKAAGADLAGAVANTSTDQAPGPGGDVPAGAHIMGGMRMGVDPSASVCDPSGRVHGLENVFVTDASVFVTSGSHNPTLTLMAVALRSARQFAG